MARRIEEEILAEMLTADTSDGDERDDDDDQDEEEEEGLSEYDLAANQDAQDDRDRDEANKWLAAHGHKAA